MKQKLLDRISEIEYESGDNLSPIDQMVVKEIVSDLKNDNPEDDQLEFKELSDMEIHRLSLKDIRKLITASFVY